MEGNVKIEHVWMAIYYDPSLFFLLYEIRQILLGDALFYVTINHIIYVVVRIHHLSTDLNNGRLSSHAHDVNRHCLVAAEHVNKRISVINNTKTAMKYHFWDGMVCLDPRFDELSFIT
jgi:hypothetical protein